MVVRMMIVFPYDSDGNVVKELEALSFDVGIGSTIPYPRQETLPEVQLPSLHTTSGIS